MKKYVPILLMLSALCACHSESPYIAKNKQLADSLSAVTLSKDGLQKKTDSLAYELLIFRLSKVGYKNDTIAIKDTASYSEYLAECKHIDSVWEKPFIAYWKKEGAAEEKSEKAKMASLRLLFQSMKNSPEYAKFSEHLVYTNYAVTLPYWADTVLSSPFEEEYERRFSALEEKYTMPLSPDYMDMINKKSEQIAVAWGKLKARNLPVKR